MINAKVSRLARAMLNWNQTTLAERVGTSLNTVRSFEAGELTVNSSTVNAIQRTLESAGVIFRADGIDSADDVLSRYETLKNPTREQTSEAIVCAGIVRRAGGRRRMTDERAKEMLRLGRERRGEE